jgi:hypothetical protein
MAWLDRAIAGFSSLSRRMATGEDQLERKTLSGGGFGTAELTCVKPVYPQLNLAPATSSVSVAILYQIDPDLSTPILRLAH